MSTHYYKSAKQTQLEKILGPSLNLLPQLINLNEAVVVSGDKDVKENTTEAGQDGLIFPPAWMH